MAKLETKLNKHGLPVFKTSKAGTAQPRKVQPDRADLEGTKPHVKK